MLVVVLLAAASWGAYRVLAAGGMAARGRLATWLERRLGELARAAVEAAGTPLQSAQMLGALAAVQERLAQGQAVMGQRQAPEPAVEIRLLDSPVVNAQAFPGGLIVIHSGLLDSLDSAEQLAAVVAHEMAHLHYQDSLAALRRQLGLSLLLGLVGLPQGGEALERIVEQAAHIRYTRRVEARADRYALDLLAASRLDPGHLAEALQRIAGDPGQGRLPALLRYLEDHPPLEDRLQAARARSRELGVAEEPLGVRWPDGGPDPGI